MDRKIMIKIFTKKDCPRCPGAKELGQKLHEKGKKVEYFDIDTASGLAEASFYTVMSTPTVILTNQKGDEISSWRGEVPSLNSILPNC
ncbi:MAG: thioredoxin family protein [bacterium]|nr:thioredoxin family protein [bacterium]